MVSTRSHSWKSLLVLHLEIVSCFAFTSRLGTSHFTRRGKLPELSILYQSSLPFIHDDGRGKERTRHAAHEVYSFNSTQLLDEMDHQLRDFKKLEQATSRLRHFEHGPLHDLSSNSMPQQTLVEITEMNNKVSSDGKETEGVSDLWKARLLLIGAAALYGTNFSLVKHLGDIMPVGVSTFFRFGAAALATMPWLLQDIRKDNDALVAAWLGFEVGLWNSIGYVSQAVGLDSTPAAESAFICSLAVVTVPMLDFLEGKKLLPRQWAGAFLAVVGVAFLELVGGSASPGHSLSTGDVLTMVQPFAFGIGFRRMEQAMHRFPKQASRMTAAQLLAVFMASLAYGFWAIDLPTLQSFPWNEWITDSSVLFSLFWTGVITTALSIYMENKAMETLSAAETTLIFSTEPLWGAAFAGLVMGEELGPNVALGAAFILTACLYSNLGMVGLKNIWQGGIAAVEPLFGRGKPFVVQSHVRKVTLPSLGPELVWLTANVQTRLAWWKVAASNIVACDKVTDDFFE